MKNEFSYYSTISSITWLEVINPAHLLLCGLHAHTHCDSISHRTYPAALPHTYSHNLKCSSLGISSSPLHTSIFLPLTPLPLLLPEPNFVSSYDIGNFTYFFFRENAVEHDCGRMVFSRAGRVCKNDIGGRFLLEDTWTTFMKARLNCSRPGEIPFNYNELQGTFYLPELELLYGIFTTNV